MNYLQIIFWLSCSFCLFGQDNSAYTVRLTNGTLITNFDNLKSFCPDIDVAYSSDLLQAYTFTRAVELKQVSPDSVMTVLLSDTDLTYEVKGNQYLVFKKPNYVVSHKVVDALTGDGVPFATLMIDGQGVQCDVEGTYTHTLPLGKNIINVDAIGYKALRLVKDIRQNQTLVHTLNTDNNTYQVVISDSVYSQSIYHYAHYDAANLLNLTKYTPGLGGVNDIMHTIRSLPGIQSGGGGIGGHYVRGSSNSENFVLIDGVPIFFPYHSMGLTSVLDANYVKDLQVYKSGFNPKYGGRASSIVDVQIKRGDQRTWKAKLDGSLQATSLLAQGPVIPEKSSLLLYGRHSTWLHGYNKVLQENFSTLDRTDIGFYDFLAKYEHDINDKTSISALVFHSADHVDERDDSLSSDLLSNINSNIKWKNQALALSIQHRINYQSGIRLKGYYSRFQNGWDEISEVLSFFTFSQLRSGIVQKGLSMDAYLYSKKWQSLEFGINLTDNVYENRIDFVDADSDLGLVDSIDVISMINPEDSITSSNYNFYFKHSYDWDNWKLQYGAHFSNYFHRGESISHIEPRVNVTYASRPSMRWTTSLSKMVQYMHLSAPSGVTFPQDLWVPSRSDRSPLVVWHYDLGWHWYWAKGYKVNINAYYKDIRNSQINDQNLINDNLELQAVDGHSLGLELNIQKVLGRWRGNLGYSLSRSTRQALFYNLGNKFDFQFDRRHELKMISSYKLYKGWTLGNTLYYGSSHPRLTVFFSDFLSGLFLLDEAETGEKNQLRGNSHFRVDLSLYKSWKTKFLTHELKLGVYNATNNENPIIYRVDNSGNERPGLFIEPIYTLQYGLSF